ncbi:iron-sulfur cluster assembly accessory protein [Candidatus Woesearchaeota archaeon]|nr:iron-sulfur cluster assembly accessory protein [Candidatus Woesearchaeota archaeon]
MDITFTDKAVDKIKEIREKEKKTESYFRVGITTGGCSGFSYLMAFEDKKGADDLELDKKGLKVVVDKQSMEMLHGCNVDFVETLKEQGFKIENPNAAKTCGCGSSFR